MDIEKLQQAKKLEDKIYGYEQVMKVFSKANISKIDKIYVRAGYPYMTNYYDDGYLADAEVCHAIRNLLEVKLLEAKKELKDL